MTPKYCPILWWPQKNIHKIFIPRKILIFLKIQKNIEIQSFEPQNNDLSLRQSIPPSPPPPPPPWMDNMKKIFLSETKRPRALICSITSWTSTIFIQIMPLGPKLHGDCTAFFEMSLRLQHTVSAVWTLWKRSACIVSTVRVRESLTKTPKERNRMPCELRSKAWMLQGHSGNLFSTKNTRVFLWSQAL